MYQDELFWNTASMLQPAVPVISVTQDSMKVSASSRAAHMWLRHDSGSLRAQRGPTAAVDGADLLVHVRRLPLHVEEDGR